MNKIWKVLTFCKNEWILVALLLTLDSLSLRYTPHLEYCEEQHMWSWILTYPNPSPAGHASVSENFTIIYAVHIFLFIMNKLFQFLSFWTQVRNLHTEIQELRDANTLLQAEVDHLSNCSHGNDSTSQTLFSELSHLSDPGLIGQISPIQVCMLRKHDVHRWKS